MPAIRSRRAAAIFVIAVAIAVVAALAVAASLSWQEEEDAVRVVGMPTGEAVVRTAGAAHAAALPSLAPAAGEPLFPIRVGAVGPVQAAAEPLQYPFLCATERSGLGQPLVDNQDGHGIAVYRETADGRKTGELIGYSRDCSVPTRVDYFYKPVGKTVFVPWRPGLRDVDTVRRDGRSIPFVVRLERGTINRFLYATAVLAAPDEDLEAPDGRFWNRRLIYHFVGGVGIGRRQGKLSTHRVLDRNADALAQGYAIATSTGNHTTNHYNMRLAGDTALRVKRQFVARHGAPLYTVGLGGSGGGLQQYLFAQNLPGLLDAAIAQYSYPDMVTQTIHALDCELLEYYFDVAAPDTARWREHDARRPVTGLNARSDADNRFAVLYPPNLLLQGRWPRLPAGSNECVQGWRGLTPLVLNPRFTPHAGQYADAVLERVRWTYWDDLASIYGIDASGHARRTWDNVGVQYGLEALRRGAITADEFLDLNARIGGWKPAAQMGPESFWLPFGKRLPLWFSLWSAHNMTRSAGAGPAPRSAADADAIAAAYRSGQVFLGHIDIPVIDLRHYREAELNMHHTSASLAARLRIERAMGDARHQAIWIAHRDHDPTPQALAVIDAWLLALRAAPARGLAGNRPAAAHDTCFDADGGVIARGDGVWDGAWNGRGDGACTRVYPFFGTTRTAAGAPLAGDVFKCQLQPVDAAIAAGVYAPADMRAHARRLAEIFPDGVCDYTRGDAGRPADALAAVRGAAAAPVASAGRAP